MASRLDFSQIRSLYVGTSSSTQVDTNNLIVAGNVGIGTTSPGQKLQIDSPLRTEFYGTDSASPADAMNIVGTGASRALGTGSALLFSVPANTDGTNMWAQARILGTGDNATNGNAEGAMFLQTRALYNPGVGGSWNWRTNMVLRASGNVGIGTTNPTGKLHIAQSNSGGVAAILLSEDESTIQGPAANTQIRMGSNLVLGASNIMTFGTNGSEKMRITSGGNVLIGTDTDNGRKLNVSGDIFSSGEIYSNQYAAGRYIRYNWNTTNFYVGASTATRWVIGRIYWNQVHWGNYSGMDIEIVWNYYNGARKKYSITNGAGGGGLYLRESQSYASAYGRITLGSAVDTGTTSGGYSNFYQDVYLDVTEYNQVSVNGELKGSQISIDKTSIGGGEYGWATFFSSPTSSNISLFTNQAATILSSEGNWGYIDNKLGINNSNPSGTLHVQFNAADGQNAVILRTQDGGGNGVIRWQNNGATNQAGIGSNYNVGDSGALEFLNGATTNMMLRGNGNLLINTTTDAGYKLDVSGTGRFGGNLDVGGSIAMSGTSVSSLDLSARVQSAVTGDLIGYGVRMISLSPSSGSYVVANMYAVKTATPVVQPNTTVTNSYGVYIGRTDDPVSGGIVTNKYALVTEALAGNVGIGTTSPATALEVAGTVTLKSSAEGGPHIYRDGGNAGDIRFFSTNGTFASPTAKVAEGLLGQIHYAGYDGSSYITAAQIWSIVDGAVSTGVVPARIEFKTGTAGAATQMTIKSSGNVLIGTTTDSGYKLDVNGSARVDNANGLTISGFSTGTGLRLNYGNSSGEIQVINLIANGVTNGYIGLQMVDSSNGDMWFGTTAGRTMTIYRNGNVGIGTTSPSYKLQISDTAANGRAVQAVQTATSGTNYGAVLAAEGVGATKNVGLYANAIGATTNYAAIFANGDVGIGTTAPQQLLHVLGATNGYAMIQGASDSGQAGIYFKKEDTTGTMDRTKGLIVFHTNVGSGWGRGNLGFCLNSADSNAVVSVSDEKFRMVDNGDFLADGDVVAYSTTISDARYKTNIQPIESALDKVNQMRGVSFDWTAVRSGREFGVIAQEIEQIAPEVVSEKELLNGDTMKTVSYTSLVPFLIESIKELTQQVNELKAQLDGLTK